MTAPQIDTLKAELLSIEQGLDAEIYQPGQWQRFLIHADAIPQTDLALIKDDITRVSNKVHRRHSYFEIPFTFALVLEIAFTLTGVVCLLNDQPFVVIVGVVCLALGLQPTIKLSVGTLLGVKYSYVYFWNVEPRFKMQYGSYIILSPQRKFLFHLSGAIGTPLAMLLGYLAFEPDLMLLAQACLVFFMLASLMQVGAFAAEWYGFRKIGGHVLANITSPATAAAELKKYREDPPRSQSQKPQN